MGQKDDDNQRSLLHAHRPLMIHQAFHEQALKTPHAVCLIHASTGETLTYQQTQHRVLKLAHELHEQYGATLETVVAIYMEPSVPYVIAMLAILTAGAAYVPLELAYPIPMLQNVLQDVTPVCIITTLQHKSRLPVAITTTTATISPSSTDGHHHHTATTTVVTTTPQVPSLRVLCVDDNLHTVTAAAAAALIAHPKSTSNDGSADTTISSTATTTTSRTEEQAQVVVARLLETAATWPQPNYDNLAFVVYSSGTTGQAKGIANPHIAPALSYAWRFDCVSDYKASTDIVACHVFFVWECLRPLMRGAAVVPIPSDIVFDSEQLIQVLQKYRVTEMLFTPSLLENVWQTSCDNVTALQTQLSSLKTVFLNGEVVSMTLRARCLQLLPNCRFINLYSISECHEVGAVDLRDIDATLTTSSKFCPIGPPASVCDIYILDEDQQPVSNGEAGELYVAGQTLARGYLNLPELTASRFLPNPFVDQQLEPKMYRTGDRARLLENGHLEILGRCDFMVKIRGYSIVLGAVEAALMEAVCLTSCVVVADGEEGEDKHLVAYLVRDTTATASSQQGQDGRLTSWTVDGRTGACPEIRHAVDGLLPHYMVPSVFIEVETLPVSAVGAKLDRKALQAQTADRRTMLRSLQLSTETHTTHLAAAAVAAATSKAASVHEDDAINKDEDDAVMVSLLRLVKYLRLPKNAPIQDVRATMILLWEQVLDKPPGVITMSSDFHGSGGHSLSAARLAALVNKVFLEICSTKISAMDLFRDNTTVKGLCDQVVMITLAATATVESSSSDESTSKDPDSTTTSSSDKEWSVVEAHPHQTEDDEMILQQVLHDSVLPIDLVVPKSTGTVVVTLKDARSIFLTGATGFLGVHLLAEILNKNTSATVLCLVRSKDPLAVKANLEQYNVSADLSRIVLVQGDLSLPLFGLNQAEWNRIAATVDAVVHCGAAVSLTATYRALQPANVHGTLSAIRLAAACRPGSPLIYVSSNGIFPTDKGANEIFLENDDVACLPGRLGASDGYGLSKWAAERLVTEAHAHGLPTMTIRFGNLGWHSATGVGNSLDYQGMLLDGCMRLAQRPNVKGWQFEVTPVDFAASALVALAENQNLLMEGSIFNCVQEGFTAASEIFDWMAESRGNSIPAVPLGAWKQSVEDAAANTDDNGLTALFAFTSGMQESYLSKMAYLDCSKLDAALARVEPSLTRRNLVSKEYFCRFFEKAHVVPSAVSTRGAVAAVPVDPLATGIPTGPLAGQVAVVTGASSGIGRAIVQSLIEAGCHVAMGARRLGELEKTRELVSKCCPGSASKTIIVSTDVTKRDQVSALVEQAERSLGPVDILVNCAGVMYFTLMKNVIWDQWERTVDVNCKGTMYGIGTVLPRMLERGNGHIVNITSDAGRKAFPGLAVYSGAKFFVEAVSQALRAETASTGLKVTCIQPGNVETPLLSTSTDPEGLKEYGEPTGAKVLEPADIGRAVVYAVSQPEWCAVNEILVEPREEPA